MEFCFVIAGLGKVLAKPFSDLGFEGDGTDVAFIIELSLPGRFIAGILTSAPDFAFNGTLTSKAGTLSATAVLVIASRFFLSLALWFWKIDSTDPSIREVVNYLILL